MTNVSYKLIPKKEMKAAFPIKRIEKAEIESDMAWVMETNK